MHDSVGITSWPPGPEAGAQQRTLLSVSAHRSHKFDFASDFLRVAPENNRILNDGDLQLLA